MIVLKPTNGFTVGHNDGWFLYFSLNHQKDYSNEQINTLKAFRTLFNKLNLNKTKVFL